MNEMHDPMSAAVSSQARYLAFFVALCLFLAAVEYAIPKPLPFLRLGLANVPVMLSLGKMRPRDTLLLVLCKVIGQGILSGTLFSYLFIFSAAGSFASALIMLAVYALGKNHVSCVGISLTGAGANTAAQLVLARYILFGENTRYIAPILLVTGVITGCALGIFTEVFKQKSAWYAQFLSFTQTARHR